MPLFLPVTMTTQGHPLDVWGDVRPAPNAARTSHRRQVVQIQYSWGDTVAFRTLQSVPITGRYGYFEVRHTFPGWGRSAWRGPRRRRRTECARTVDITLR